MISPRNGKVALRLEPPIEKSGGGIYLPDRNRSTRIGRVEGVSESSSLRLNDLVVRSEYDKTVVDGNLVLVDEDFIYCRIRETMEWTPGTTHFSRANAIIHRAIEAFANRLILLVDPLTESEKWIPEQVRQWGYLNGTNTNLKKATVLDAGEFWTGRKPPTGSIEDIVHWERPWKAGDRLWVAPDAYDCLQVLPCDKDLPWVNVPEGQEVRIYSPSYARICAQVFGFVEDEVMAA